MILDNFSVTFKHKVKIVSPNADWTGVPVAGSGDTSWTFTAKEAVLDGTTFTITVENDKGKTLTVNTVINIVSVFSRAGAEERYIIEKYENGIATLRKLTDDVLGDAAKYTFGAADASLAKLIEAIYTPNKPGSAKTVEGDKRAIKYDEALSKSVLDLFQIVVGPTVTSEASSTQRVELIGANLPKPAGASNTNLVVIDIGQPGVDNKIDETTFMAFSIPLDDVNAGSQRGQLGDGSNASHIRLRVNSGASLVIEADNTGYITGGAGNSCPEGKFQGGCVEVMAGGHLRDGAYEGFPLGAGAVILNRYNSYLSVGPEAGSDDATASSDAYSAYYAGYLVGPETETNTRIFWDDPQATNNYLEVRPGVIATNARLTVQKNVGLIYSVWFLSGASLTIKGGEGETKIHLATNERTNDGPDYNFYFNEGVTLTMEANSQIDNRFFETPGKASTTTSLHDVTEGGWTQTILARDLTGSPVPYVNASTRNRHHVPTRVAGIRAVD